MKKIEIKIPDNLTPAQEAATIAKKLLQKQLIGVAQNKDQILIGQGVEVIELQTQITVTRVSKEKPIEMVTCNVCGCEYQNNTALYFWHNYGGNPRKTAVCSELCQSNVIELLTGRAAKTKARLTPIRFW